jgi:hypothetical protein
MLKVIFAWQAEAMGEAAAEDLGPGACRENRMKQKLIVLTQSSNKLKSKCFTLFER